jgi:hypothetical protein
VGGVRRFGGRGTSYRGHSGRGVMRLFVHAHGRVGREDGANGAHDWQAGVEVRGRGGVAMRGGLGVLVEPRVNRGRDAVGARRLERFVHLSAGPLGCISAYSIKPHPFLVLPAKLSIRQIANG